MAAWFGLLGLDFRSPQRKTDAPTLITYVRSLAIETGGMHQLPVTVVGLGCVRDIEVQPGDEDVLLSANVWCLVRGRASLGGRRQINDHRARYGRGVLFTECK